MEIRNLGRYHVRGRIGRGTMGIVYRGYDPVLEREVALKTVDLSPGLDDERRSKFLSRFFQEARIAAKLLHAGIVVTHDASTDESTGIPFIAMELVPGGSLGELIERRGRVSWEEAVRLAILMARALDYAHRAGVVHRDIKPANVLLTTSGEPKIADFGIAKLSDSHLTQTGAVIGTPYYMSPEQLEAADVDGRSDLFSLGALLFTLLTGEPPFRGPDLATITRQVLHKNPEPPSELVGGIPVALDGVVARALAKLPEERYASGTELAEDLERVLRGEAPEKPLSFGEKTIESAKPALGGPPAPPAKDAPELVLEPSLEGAESEPRETESPSRGGFWFWSFAILAIVLVALRWTTVSRFVTSQLAMAETTLRERNDEAERQKELASRAAKRLDEGRESFSHGRLEAAGGAFDEALAVAREAKDGAGEASALLWRGRLASEFGDWSRARADLESAASVYEIYDVAAGVAEATVARAHLERDLGELDRAEALYESVASIDSVREEVTLGRALLALMRGDSAAAEKGFRSLLETSGESARRARAALLLGAVQFAEGRADEAETSWSQADELTEPRLVDLYRGYAARAAGRDEDAQRIFRRCEDAFRAHDEPAALASALDGLAGRKDEGVLRTIDLGEPRSARSDERRSRLPVTLSP